MDLQYTSLQHAAVTSRATQRDTASDLDSVIYSGIISRPTGQREEFIEEILAPPFGGMITFVKESEALMEKGQLDKLKNDEETEDGKLTDS
ncbi:hypothetical protein SRHO_G00098990 [Serrasalmus rhombeus]